MQTINDLVQALQELQDLEASGIKLKYRPAFILQQEIHGNTVDLESGVIYINGANQRRQPPHHWLEEALP